MSEEKDSGDRTEKPTQKRLSDARKKGDVSQSKDVTSTAGLLAWVVVFLAATRYVSSRLLDLSTFVFTNTTVSFEVQAGQSIQLAAELVLVSVAALVVPVALVSIVAQFLQVGPIFTTKKMELDFSRINPVDGLKKMFSTDNLVQVGLGLAKTIVIALLVFLLLRSYLGEFVRVMQGQPGDYAQMLGKTTLSLMGWTVAVFAFLSIIDAGYQKYSYLKKMRMSMRDIRDELKEDEGDPMLRGQRKGLQREWLEHNANESAAKAQVLVVNPTHVAIALSYDKEEYPIPTVTAKGEDHLAAQMRETARRAGVPIVRNVNVARALLLRAEIGDVVPSDMFDVVAQIILWAQREREKARALAIARSAKNR